MPVFPTGSKIAQNVSNKNFTQREARERRRDSEKRFFETKTSSKFLFFFSSNRLMLNDSRGSRNLYLIFSPLYFAILWQLPPNSYRTTSISQREHSCKMFPVEITLKRNSFNHDFLSLHKRELCSVLPNSNASFDPTRKNFFENLWTNKTTYWGRLYLIIFLDDNHMVIRSISLTTTSRQLPDQ